MTKDVAVFGAAGSMGTRVTNALNDDPDFSHTDELSVVCWSRAPRVCADVEWRFSTRDFAFI
jgi:dihydrodipicolinate reductase